MALQHSPSIVTTGLVMCLDAANRRSYSGSGTAWNDVSGTGNNGTLLNGVSYESTNNGTLVFNGIDQYSSVPQSATNNITSNQITFGSW